MHTVNSIIQLKINQGTITTCYNGNTICRICLHYYTACYNGNTICRICLHYYTACY